jgi:hypothetical protein
MTLWSNYQANQVGGKMLRQIRTESNQELKALSLRNLGLRLRRELGAFHEEEHGSSGSVDNVMIIFIAAIILVGLIALFKTGVWAKVKTNINNLMQSSVS